VEKKLVTNRGSFKTLVFLPAFNEEATVGHVVHSLKELYSDFDVLVVDDGSTDTTSACAELAGAQVLRLPINVGVGGAVKCALRFAFENEYTKAFQIDADGQHDPVYITNLFQKVTEGCDLVIGNRFGSVKKYPIGKLRMFTIRIISVTIRFITGITFSDPTSGFRGFSRKAIVSLHSDFPTEYLGDTIQCLILAHHRGLSISEIPVEMRERQGGVPSSGPIRSFGHLIRALFAISVSQIRQFVSKGESLTES
jgi:glycosyltransferase involved in cell wall biosynthesis